MITKNKIKNYLKLGIFLFGIVFALINCKNEAIDITDNKSSIKIKHISFNELKKKAPLKTVLSNVSKTENKNIIATDSTFIIHTNHILETSNANTNTTNYSFRMTRPIRDNNYFENFVISEKNNQYTYFILKYERGTLKIISSTKVDANLVNQSILSFIDKLVTLDDCIEVYYLPCNGVGTADGHAPTSNCDGSATVLDFSNCFGNESGGGSNSGNNNNNNNNQDNNNNNNNNNNGGSSTPSGSTSINPPCKTCLKNNTNCDELKKLFKTPTHPISLPLKSTKSAISYLNTQLDFYNEKGFSFFHDANFNAFAKKTTNNGSNHVRYGKSPRIYGGAHIHQNDGEMIPMFSAEDVRSLYHFYIGYDYLGHTGDEHLPVHILVTSQETYAIKIGNLSQFTSQMQSFKQSPKKFKTFKRLLINKLGRFFDKTSSTVDGSAKQFQKAFLKLVNERYNLGIALYKANSSFDNWFEITLDPNVSGTTQGLHDTPCI